jgi:gamma-glutamyltranspeptidase/glutathione hydrolase
MPARVFVSVLALVWALLPAAAAAQGAPGPLARLAGAGRVETAVAVSQAGWRQAPTVLLATAADFPDALAAAPLAAQADAPLLLTDPGALSPATRDELRRLGAREVIVLGGRAAVSGAVVDALTADGYAVRRIAGDTRYATAAEIALAVGAADEVVLASGEGFADALAAGALSAGPDALPVLLTRGNDVPARTEQALTALGVESILLVGGEAAVSGGVQARLRERGFEVERLAGATRFDTAAVTAGEALSRRALENPFTLVAASGAAFPDALSAAPLAARRDGLFVLVPADDLANAPGLARLLFAAGDRLDGGAVVGGRAAVSDTVLDQLAAAVLSTTPARTPAAEGSGGAAATVDPHASAAAIAVLRDGGNAVDAAIAAAGVLGVVEPFSAGIGGGGFMLVYDAAQGRVVTYDSREEAPAAYDPQVFVDPDTGEPIPFPERVVSGLGVGVPGTVAGWQLALERHGTRTLAELLQPGAELARVGFPVDVTFAEQVTANAEKFATFTPTADIYLDENGAGPELGAWFRNPDLAETYDRIADGGARAFYEGEIAAAIVAAVQQPPVADGVEANVRAGRMTPQDLASYQALVRAPVTSTYRDVTVYGMGLPSSGGLTIALALNQLERFEMDDRAEGLHHYLESIRRAWADRNAFMGDPEFVDVPVTGLLSQDYADDRSDDIRMRATRGEVEPGNPYAYQNDASPSPPPEGMVTTLRDGSTTHLTVADGDGNIVSYTFTIEQIGGSGIVVPGYGFLLNNELTDFNPVAPHPNAPEANKRPRSSISPTIVLRDGEPVLAVGTPGGATIITTVLQILVEVIDFERTLPEAIATPRLANFNGEQSIAEEAFLQTPEAAALMARGHEFTTVPEIGAATGIAFGPDGGLLAAAEPERRGIGSALVVEPGS